MDISTRGGELQSRRSAQVSEGEESARRTRCGCSNATAPLFVARSGLRAADQRAEPTHLATFQSRSRANIAAARRYAARSAADLDRRPGHHGHEDVHVQARQLSHRSELRRQQPIRQRLEGRLVCAARAPLRARRALVLQRRDLRLSRPGDLRRQGAIASSTSKTKKTATTRTPSPAAGSQRCSTTSSPPQCRRSIATLRLPAERRCQTTTTRLSYRGPLQTVAGRRHAHVQRDAVRRSEAAGAAGSDRAEARADRRLRQAHDHRAAAVLAARARCTASSATGAGRSSSSRS